MKFAYGKQVVEARTKAEALEKITAAGNPDENKIKETVSKFDALLLKLPATTKDKSDYPENIHYDSICSPSNTEPESNYTRPAPYFIAGLTVYFNRYKNKISFSLSVSVMEGKKVTAWKSVNIEDSSDFNISDNKIKEVTDKYKEISSKLKNMMDILNSI